MPVYNLDGVVTQLSPEWVELCQRKRELDCLGDEIEPEVLAEMYLQIANEFEDMHKPIMTQSCRNRAAILKRAAA